jgi:hypothetical protein
METRLGEGREEGLGGITMSIHAHIGKGLDHVSDSQSETICEEEDEEMTEEEEGEEEEEEDEEEEDDGNMTDESDCASEEIPLSHLSPEIQNFVIQFPEVSEHFQILSKIGEGNQLSLALANHKGHSRQYIKPSI